MPAVSSVVCHSRTLILSPKSNNVQVHCVLLPSERPHAEIHSQLANLFHPLGICVVQGPFVHRSASDLSFTCASS